ncbi:MAG: stage II sporulation protein R [Ruminococcus sp.]|nr:stage II sporulation protein R [Candidatus Copronaster equi]
MNLLKKIEISVCVALIISIIFSTLCFAGTSENIRNEVLRLHIIANSDSEKDQKLKLKVRDKLLECGSEVFCGTVTAENAVEKITPKIAELEAVAKRVIVENGFDYDVKITINKEYFTTRTYKDVTLPAGKYMALRVIIGQGNGHNWWCVMFPTMCLPAADSSNNLEKVFDKKEVRLVKKKPAFEPRFKIVEIYESVVNHK